MEPERSCPKLLRMLRVQPCVALFFSETQRCIRRREHSTSTALPSRGGEGRASSGEEGLGVDSSTPKLLALLEGLLRWGCLYSFRKILANYWV